MKATKIFAPLFALGVALSGVAHAETMDASQADKSTVHKRQVSYSCSKGGAVKVTYGFNKQKLPTYAEANLGGKTRFLPINLSLSDMAGTQFGDENSWTIATDALTLGNYQKSDIIVQNPDSQITHKTCRVTTSKKLK